MAMVVAIVCIGLISVPLLALFAVRLTSNQFVRETEQSLIYQGSIYAKVFAEGFRVQGGPGVGVPLGLKQKDYWSAELRPARPQLNVRFDQVLPPRPDGVPVGALVDQRYTQIADQLISLARNALKTTLAGVVFLDHQGRDINPTSPYSFAALPEVQTALKGEIGAMLRARGDDYDPHPLSSLSRDTGYRVFLTYPVILNDHVIGVIYLSRTPLNLGKFLFQERFALLSMLASTAIGAAVIGFLLLRLISRPIYALRNESRAIAAGERDTFIPLDHYGVRELADLGDGVSTMAETLSQRSREISTYTDHVTHELKSPVTAIIGAAELLGDKKIKAQSRRKLLENITTEGQRMNALLGHLRQMAQIRSSARGGPALLADMLPEIESLNVTVAAESEARLPISQTHGQMILHHMAQNAHEHCADDLWLSYSGGVLKVLDNGDGIAKNDQARVTEPFFTTRRDDGGTGMGLAIVSAVLEGYGAKLSCLPNERGACFEIDFRET